MDWEVESVCGDGDLFLKVSGEGEGRYSDPNGVWRTLVGAFWCRMESLKWFRSIDF